MLMEIYSEVCPERMAICHVVRANLEKLAGETDLGGYCAIGSVGLALAFRRAGFDAEVIVGFYMENMRHCWVISDGIIYDITITQFGKQWPKVWAEEYEPVHPADEDVNRFLPETSVNPADWKRLADFFEHWLYRQQPTICRVGCLLPTPTRQTLQLVSAEKARILRWMAFWSLINDFVRRMFRAIYYRIAGALQTISDKMFV